ncbi:alpha-L-rhamnosidase [Thelonectria olida]|uniref:Alpha-L-rhamnosidase n=1 Tax=Thelonectria olida TaxID=1576542 RepID=A0A9P9AKW1_9HYPO|nr:alpha-L-rhamnosidase [Thelonectria olida]
MLFLFWIEASIAVAVLGLINKVGGCSLSCFSSIVPKSSPGLSYNGSIIYGSKETTTLTSNGTVPSIMLLDFGENVEGFPTFEVVSASGDTSGFEISYGESRAALDLYMVSSSRTDGVREGAKVPQSDGPIPLSAAMDTYRVKQYNLTGPSVITNRLIQGAFRYQKLNLSSPGTLQLKNVGVKPTTSTTPLTELPGSFKCSDEDLSRIWHAGARTLQLNEIPKNTVPDFLQVTDEGAYVESLAPQALGGTVAPLLLDYRLDLQVKPVKGGFGVSVLCDTLSSCIYISFDLVHHTATAYAGSTTVDTQLATAFLPTNITLDTWHSIRITVNSTSLTASLNSHPVLSLTQTARLYGSFGFGASFGHAAYFRNLNATTFAGETIYTSPLTNPSFLADFLLGGNPTDTIVDGSRRDRIAYTGDLDVALGASFASTFSTSFIDGSLDLLGSYQALPGFFIPAVKIQQEPLAGALNTNMTGLIGYAFSFVSALAQNYEIRGNITFAREWAPKIVKMLDWADSQTLPNGLFNVTDASFGLDWNHYDPTQMGAVTKFNTVYAYSLQQSLILLKDAGVDITEYQARLERLRIAINENLWSEDLGVYIMSDSFRTGFAQDANALAILAGVPPTNASPTILSNLAKELFLSTGPLSFSKSTASAGWAEKLSPYASAYHLRAAFETHDASSALTLLKTLWAPMADPTHTNYTNCFWEVLEADGTPGLGIGTSLCHAWAAGPTAELSRHVLGIQPTAPGFAEWKVEPQTLGLEWAEGRYPTVLGNFSVEWRFDHKLLRMNVESPVGSKGMVLLPQPLPTAHEGSVIRVNGVVRNGTQFMVNGGDVFVLTQEPPNRTY